MKAVIVPQPGRLSIDEVACPVVGPYDALVRITCCGICNSTDWKVIQGQMPWAGRFPLVLGHESVGTVEQVGAKVRKFKVGDQVSRPIVPRSEAMGSAWGGFAEYGIVTDAQAMADDGDPSMLGDYNAQRQNVVPGDVDPVWAALAISLAETSSVLDAAPTVAGRRVLIAGTGIAGLALTLWCKLAGASRVVTLGRRPERLAKARDLGADEAIDTTADDWRTGASDALGGKADLMFEAIGHSAFADSLLTLLAEGGAAIAYGAPPDGEAFSAGWQNASVREQDRYPWVIDLIQRGWVDPEWFISHKWPFDEALNALEQVRRGEVLKGFVVIPGHR